MTHPILIFLRQSWLVLVLATGLSAGLAGVDFVLRDRITENSRKRLETAVLEVVPGGLRSETVTIAGVRMYRVRNEAGDICGWATPAETRGFQDRIQVMIGVSGDGSQMTGLTILESSETPGLGDRIQQPQFRDQFVGLAADGSVTRSRTGETSVSAVDAITGATISSQAVIDAVNNQLQIVGKELTAMRNGKAEALP